MSRKIKTDQINLEEQLLVRLVWACEIEGLTQAAAAERFGITRLRVNKSLAEARERGIVRISVDSLYSACAELETALSNRFGLTKAVVVPSGDTPRALYTLISTGLGSLLHDLLQSPTIKMFGMSWGNTLNLATRYMHPINRPDLEIVSVMGGVTRGSDINSYEITTRLADLCNANHSYFTAPLYTGSMESRNVLLELDVIAEMLEKIKTCEAVAVAAGDLNSSLLVQEALPRDINAKSLIECGGVGDLLGHVLDEDGNEIDHPVNERVLGITLKELTDIPNVILAAGGKHKVKIIKAVLSRGMIDTIVTDEDTAKRLIKG